MIYLYTNTDGMKFYNLTRNMTHLIIDNRWQVATN